MSSPWPQSRKHRPQITSPLNRLRFLIFCVFPLLLTTSVLAQNAARQRQVADSEQSAAESLGQNRGTYYALIIGIANYQHLPTLKTPVRDAVEVEALLRETYGFKTQLLSDATRDQIIEALDRK